MTLSSPHDPVANAEQAQALLASIVECSEDAILSKTLDGTITSWNWGAERLYGYTAREVIGKNVSLLIPPDLADEFPAYMDRLRRGERVECYETVRVRKDGSPVDVSLSLSPIRNHAGVVIGASGIGRDITGRKRLEQALREADRKKDQFLATLAHELRNPLAPIRNAVEVLRLRGSDDPDLRASRDVIDRQVQHLSRLVDDLSEVSRITQGKVRLRREAVDLVTVVSRAAETIRPIIEERRHTLTVSLSPLPLRLTGDATRLTQVVLNLLDNAAKYTDDGGQLWLTVQRQDDEAVIRVQDTGMGIPPEMVPRVFDLFMQGDQSLTHSQGGLGIGLTLVRSLVQMHGGTVEASSDGPGQGSEFVVRLPVLADTKVTPADDLHRPVVPAYQTLACKVLVVDDNRDTTESMALLLKVWGHDVRVAHDGPKAIETAQAYRPHVILLDIGVPGLSGLEVAKQLRQDPTFGQTVLVAMTGFGTDEDRRQSKLAGFDQHWVKPVEPAALEVLLASLEVLHPERVHNS